jgi:hypothetical protein
LQPDPLGPKGGVELLEVVEPQTTEVFWVANEVPGHAPLPTTRWHPALRKPRRNLSVAMLIVQRSNDAGHLKTFICSNANCSQLA